MSDQHGEFTGQPRMAPAAPGAGVPADRHEAYRRGLCIDCFTAWQSAGRPRCSDCHDNYLSQPARGLTVVAGERRGRGPWHPRPDLQLVKSA